MIERDILTVHETDYDIFNHRIEFKSTHLIKEKKDIFYFICALKSFQQLIEDPLQKIFQ